MPTIKELTVYQFEELTDTAKETAREWYREGSEFDPEMESFETAASILGISNIDISYSGFWSQGDGASFTGNYEHAPGCSKAIREEFGTNETLAAIADGLQALQSASRLLHGFYLGCRVSRSSTHYAHSHTMQIDVDYGDEFIPDDNEEYCEYAEEKMLQLMRKFADWIYKSLEEDYEYQNSNENVDYAIIANEYEFDEDGGRV